MSELGERSKYSLTEAHFSRQHSPVVAVNLLQVKEQLCRKAFDTTKHHHIFFNIKKQQNIKWLFVRNSFYHFAFTWKYTVERSTGIKRKQPVKWNPAGFKPDNAVRWRPKPFSPQDTNDNSFWLTGKNVETSRQLHTISSPCLWNWLTESRNVKCLLACSNRLMAKFELWCRQPKN